MDIFVLVYEHQHGVDVNAFSTRHLALVGAAGIILENLDSGEFDHHDDAEEVKEQCRRIIGDKPVQQWTEEDAGKIVDAFNLAEFGETFEVHSVPLITEIAPD